MGWADHAACLREEPVLFFPIGNDGPALTQIEEAKAVQPLPRDRRLPEIEHGKWHDSRSVGWPDRERASRTQTPHRAASAMSLKTPLCH